MDVPMLEDPAIFLFKLVPLFGTPAVVAFAWWRAERMRPTSWRSTALLLGLVAVSANALVFYSGFAYALVVGGQGLPWRIEQALEEIALLFDPRRVHRSHHRKGTRTYPDCTSGNNGIPAVAASGLSLMRTPTNSRLSPYLRDLLPI
jgi:hypothetical protein